MSSSRIPGFYRASVPERRALLSEAKRLSEDELSPLDSGGIDVDVANGMIENVIGTYSLPVGLGLNFLIDGTDYLIPMAVEEPSVVAAASNAAKMIRAGGGFHTQVSRPVMIGQVQILDVEDPAGAVARLNAATPEILEAARTMVPRLVARGGGPLDVRVRVLTDDTDNTTEAPLSMLVVHLLVDCCDAMGANLVNTLAEGLADRLASLARGRVGLRILTNLADERTVTVTARVPDSALCPPLDARNNQNGDQAGDPLSAAETRAAIVSASRFAELDPYRAATHNKGIMNGVDAVVLATGNDWRAMEASAHAYAAKEGRYGPLATWREGEDGWLEGRMSLPAAVGVVGGATRTHPVARLALEILGCDGGAELGQVMAAAGLASNLAALRALATEGIQRGHMSLHARSVALGAGARGPEVERLATALVDCGEIKAGRAEQLLAQLRQPPSSES